MTAENKKKKEYLESDRFCKQRINDINEELHRLKTKEMHPASRPDKVAGKSEHDMSDYLKNVEALTDQLERTKADMMNKRIDIHNALNALPEKYACVLHKIYILNKPFHVVANEMHYSESHIYLLHGQALEMLHIDSSS